jgi:hypothetical protein
MVTTKLVVFLSLELPVKYKTLLEQFLEGFVCIL